MQSVSLWASEEVQRRYAISALARKEQQALRCSADCRPNYLVNMTFQRFKGSQVLVPLQYGEDVCVLGT